MCDTGQVGRDESMTVVHSAVSLRRHSAPHHFRSGLRCRTLGVLVLQIKTCLSYADARHWFGFVVKISIIYERLRVHGGRNSDKHTSCIGIPATKKVAPSNTKTCSRASSTVLRIGMMCTMLAPMSNNTRAVSRNVHMVFSLPFIFRHGFEFFNEHI
jgi:hypothetical protein